MNLLNIVTQLCRCCDGHCCRCRNVMQFLPCDTVVRVVRHIVELKARVAGSRGACYIHIHIGFECAAWLLVTLPQNEELKASP